MLDLLLAPLLPAAALPQQIHNGLCSSFSSVQAGHAQPAAEVRPPASLDNAWRVGSAAVADEADADEADADAADSAEGDSDSEEGRACAEGDFAAAPDEAPLEGLLWTGAGSGWVFCWVGRLIEGLLREPPSSEPPSSLSVWSSRSIRAQRNVFLVELEFSKWFELGEQHRAYVPCLPEDPLLLLVPLPRSGGR